MRRTFEETRRHRRQIGDKTMGFGVCFGKLLKLNAAGVAKLAYAADSKSAGVHSPWGFKSLLRHPSNHLIAMAYSWIFCCVCREYFPLLGILSGTAERAPTFKGHHFSSLGAHKELELFLRENLSNNFRMLDSRKR